MEKTEFVHLLHEKYQSVLLSKEQVAKELNMGLGTLNSRITKNQLTLIPPITRLGGRVLFKLEDLWSFLNETEPAKAK